VANFSSLLPLAKFDENSWWAFFKDKQPSVVLFCRRCLSLVSKSDD
jgi:hypothetical protein